MAVLIRDAADPGDDRDRQSGNLQRLLVVGEQNYNLVFFGETMPVSWLVSLDAIISTVTVGGALVFWSVYARFWKSLTRSSKLAIGAVIAAGAPVILAIASANAAATGEGLVAVGHRLSRRERRRLLR